jgi:Carboxypeptidase regulatory-like domain
MRFRFMRPLWVLLVAALLAGSLTAQRKSRKDQAAATRSVEGQVTGPSNNSVSGAVVQLKDMRTLQIRSFITKNDGQYHFSGLKTDNDYQVKAKYNAMTAGPKTISVFDDRSVVTIDLKLEKK